MVVKEIVPIGNFITAERKAKKLTQAKLAEKILFNSKLEFLISLNCCSDFSISEIFVFKFEIDLFFSLVC